MDRYFGRVALDWFEFGFAVVPIRPREKQTATSWDFAENLTQERIRKHWNQNPHHEIGFIVGEDMIVLDADTPEAVKTLNIIEESHGIKSSMIVKTTRGEHHYFRRAPNTYAKTTGHGKNPEQAIDIKTGRTMVVMPPSTGKQIILQTAKTATELSQVDQCFIDSVYLMIDKPAPRPPEPISNQLPFEAKSDDLANIIKILKQLDPDICYPEWIRVGMVIFHTTGGSSDGLDLFDAWSSNGSKYRNRREMESKWRSFRLDVPNPVTIGTLIHIAKEQGLDVADILQEKFDICETVVINGGAK